MVLGKFAHRIWMSSVVPCFSSVFLSSFPSFPSFLFCVWPGVSQTIWHATKCHGSPNAGILWGFLHQCSSLPVRELFLLWDSPLFGGWQSMGLPFWSCIGCFLFLSLSLSLVFCLSSFLSLLVPRKMPPCFLAGFHCYFFNLGILSLHQAKPGHGTSGHHLWWSWEFSWLTTSGLHSMRDHLNRERNKCMIGWFGQE